MKRVMLVVAAGFLTGLLALAWGWRQWTGPGPVAANEAVSVRVRIPAGMTLATAADTLVAKGLLARRQAFLVGARVTGQARDLKAGLYELEFGQSPQELLLDVTSGLSVQQVVTIPEGLNLDEIAEILAGAFDFSTAEFITNANSLAREKVREGRLLGAEMTTTHYDSLWSLIPAEGGQRAFHWGEGMLAPDTYHFAEGSSAEQVAATLIAAQLERVSQASASAADGRNRHLSPWELLTLASVVEAEARRADERTKIAAVYTNRLERNWRLEADPTVAFFLDKKGQRLFFKHLKIESPYNTYRNRGLPPGPIGAAGLGSLLAASAPDSSCQAMYFVSDGADGHVFSRTAREHEAAVARFKAARSRSR